MLLIRGNAVKYGEIVRVVPNGDDWKYVGLSVVGLQAGESLAGRSGEKEVALVFIEGSADVQCAGTTWNGVGTRKTPFEGPPEGAYVPANSTYEIRALTDCEVAVCSAPADGAPRSPRRLALTDRNAHIRGTGHAVRRVHNILMDPDEASGLFITEVITPAGNWSSYPPHKHDTDDPPRESALEEIYYYRAQPSAGFAFQRVYTADGDLDETMTAHDRDLVLVPRGYHVCVAAAEYTIYYLNVLAGPKHVYHMSFDPQHEWIKRGWPW